MEHRQIISNLPSMGSTQIAESQGSQSQPISVGVTVIRARNIPHIKTTFGRKRELFVTIAYGATTKKTKKQTEKRTKTVHIDGQTAVWDQRLDPFFVQPSSQLTLCLYAKRLTQRDILIGIHQMVIPNESESNISVTLGDGTRQAGQSTPPVTLDLTITVSANGTSLNNLPEIPTKGDDTLTEEVPSKPTKATASDSGGPDRSSALDYPLSPPDHIPAQSSSLMPQDQGETSIVEKARIDLVRADEVEKSIDRSKTWEGVVGKIKWVMDTLSPVAQLHPIAQMAHKVLSVIPEELSKQYQRDDNVRTLLKSMHDAFDFANHEDTLKSMKPKSRQADILTLMLRNVCICSDFIQSYINDSQFCTYSSPI
ncbi:hypothetical protein EDB92DRAFT_445415 [Lactarius akahatsu]|uniref:C2 domain-containing protein n=1 Tax=Lactarius akahatsu TaxID=416441 RepID=A0AAD4L6P3_9AGAM|nr:hypothetical protein EDB92DRAFT_445415 [Lactarius akahatsu]